MYILSELMLKTATKTSNEVLRRLDNLLKKEDMFLVLAKDHTNFYGDVIWYNTVLGSAPVQHFCHYGQTHKYHNFFELTLETEGFFLGAECTVEEIFQQEYYVNIGCTASGAMFPWALLSEDMETIESQHEGRLHGAWCPEGIVELKRFYKMVEDEYSLIKNERLERIARFAA